MRLDPQLAAFAPLVGIVLAAAGALVGGAAVLARRSRPALARELALRWAAWVAIAALVLGALGLGRVAWGALMAAVALAGVREYARAVGLAADPVLTGAVAALVALVHAAAVTGRYGLFMAMPVYATLAVFALPVLRDDASRVRERTAAAVVAVVYLGWFPAHLAYLVSLPGGVGLVLFLAFLVGLNDVAAFVTGRGLGRHPLRPALSPAKTREGAAGALGAVLGAAWLLRWLVPAFGPAQVLGAAVLVSVGSTLGDLALAALKRDLRIKDWSTAIPGHGGVLDRTNSLLFAAPLFAHFARAALG